MESEVYNQIYEQEKRHWWYKGIFALCHELLKRYTVCSLNEDGASTILDIGCGTGYWTKGLMQYGTVVAIDNAEESLAICRDIGLRNLTKASADALPIASESCDIVTAIGVIEHIDNDQGLIGEIKRVLKPGGCGVFLTSAYTFLWSEHDIVAHHKRRYTASTLKKMAKRRGLEIVKATYINMFLFLPIFLIRLIRSPNILKSEKCTKSPDLFLPPTFVNNFLYGLLRTEAWLLKWISLPFGVSLILVIRKPLSQG